MCAGQLCQLVFDFRPNLHGIDSCRFARRTCDIKLVAVLLELVQKHRGYFETPLLVDFRRTVSPQLHSSYSMADFGRPNCPRSRLPSRTSPYPLNTLYFASSLTT